MALLASYNFDEASGAVVDCSGGGHGFSLAGATVRTASGGGHTTKGITQTSGSTDAGPAVFGQTANRTLMAWVKNTADITGWFLEWNVSSLGSGSWGFLYLSSTLRIQARNAGGSNFAAVARPSDNQWHHVAGTYDGTNLRLYLDATLVATTALTAPLRTDADGLFVFDGTGTSTTIDDVRVYDAALSQATIATLMSQPVTTGAATVNGTLAGSGGGTGALAGRIQLRGTASGTGGGTGLLSGHRAKHGTLTGSGGATGLLTGAARHGNQVIGVLSGTGGGIGLLTGRKIKHGVLAGLAGGTGRIVGKVLLPQWRLVLPQIVEQFPIPGFGSLTASLAREVTVFGDENALYTSEQGSIPAGGDSYGAIPLGTKYIWHGGHVNTTVDPAIRDLWLAHGFEVESVVQLS